MLHMHIMHSSDPPSIFLFDFQFLQCISLVAFPFLQFFCFLTLLQGTVLLVLDQSSKGSRSPNFVIMSLVDELLICLFQM